MTTRVLIADDQAMVREAFSVLLGAQPGIEVVGTARDGTEAVARAEDLRPDVVVMDVRMPVLDGIEATRRITGLLGDATRILVLTTFDLDEYVYEALRAGATGFLLKDASGVELAEAVRVVARGEAMLSPDLTRRLITEFSRLGGGPGAAGATAGGAPAVRVGDQTGGYARGSAGGSAGGQVGAPVGLLTGREREVLVQIARGRSNAEIARELVVAEETVKTHVGRILRKLSLRDRTQAAVFAYENGLVTPGGDAADR
ncbi:response regulator transcription factor [Kitasatospora sp. NBC_00458]|uniref:response regulator transcription factor n=1 Tax=Kitasatospora sp. NBC_00458 TaxID=2903568 RepID=UPI002E199E3B